MLRKIGIAALAICFGLVSTGPAAAGLLFFEWPDTTGGSAGGIDASITATVAAGVMTTGTTTATNPAYRASFATPHPSLGYNSPQSGGANIESTIAFSHPLPEGARLIVYDLDFNNETVTLSADGVPPALLTQLETTEGASSFFPAWNPVTGTLVETHPASSGNQTEATVFDISGVQLLDVDFHNGGVNSGIRVAIAIPPAGIPLLPPAGIAALATMLAGALGIAHRRRVAQLSASVIE